MNISLISCDEGEVGTLYKHVFGEDGNPIVENMMQGQVDDTRVERTNLNIKST